MNYFPFSAQRNTPSWLALETWEKSTTFYFNCGSIRIDGGSNLIPNSKLEIYRADEIGNRSIYKMDTRV